MDKRAIIFLSRPGPAAAPALRLFGVQRPSTRVLNYDWQSFGRFLKIEKSHPPEARQRVSACRSSGWQAANKSFARIGQTNRSRLNQVASVDPTDARNDILGCFGRSDRSALAGFSQKANHRERQDTGYGYQKD